MTQPLRGIAVVLVTLLAAAPSCAPPGPGHARDVMGVDLGKTEWEPVTEADAVMWIAEPPPIKRHTRDSALTSRYRERIYLAPRGLIAWEKLYGGLNTSSGLPAMALEAWAFFRKRGIAPQVSDLQFTTIDNIRYAHVTAQAASGEVCFLFFAYFGDTPDALYSAGDQDVRGGECIVPTGPAAAAADEIETRWKGLLARLRFDGPRLGWRGQGAVKAAPTGAEFETRPIAIRWSGVEELVAGEIRYRRTSGGSGTIRITLPQRRGECDGRYTIGAGSRGIWSLSCSNGVTAKGTMVAFGAGKGSAGEGRDSRGASISFTVGGRD